MLSQLSAISGNVTNVANVANYYSGLQSSLAVTDGVVTVVSGTELVLAFQLKEDSYDAVSIISQDTFDIRFIK